MALSCSLKLIKYILFFLNFLFFIVGCIILGVGIWVLSDSNASNYMHIATVSSSDNMAHSSGALLVCVGLFIFLTSMFGCCGAIKQNTCCLIIYAAIVGFVLFLQIMAGILGASFKNEILQTLDKSLNTTVHEKYGQSGEDDLTASYDLMQEEFECCGATVGPDDWKQSAWKNLTTTTTTVPNSCCVGERMDNGTWAPKSVQFCNEAANAKGNGTYLHVKSCEKSMEDWFRSHIQIIIGVAFGFMFVEIFVLVAAIMLCNAIRHQYEYV